MRYRKLSATGDYTFGHDQMDFYRDVPEAVGQAVATRILLWLGEWFLDITDGTPFMLGVLGKYSIQQADQIIQDRTLSTQGITDIQSNTYVSVVDPNTRAMTTTFTIDTIYGPTQVQLDNYVRY